MKYRNAKRLHNEDEVTVKKTKRIMRVITTEDILSKDIYIMLEDGNYYHHSEVA